MEHKFTCSLENEQMFENLKLVIFVMVCEIVVRWIVIDSQLYFVVNTEICTISYSKRPST